MKKVLYPELTAEIAKRGDTLKSIGKLLDINYSSVSRKLAGQTCWTITEIDKLCEYFNKDYYELFKRND